MIKNQLTKKIIAVFLTLNFLNTFVPYNLLYASNNGPNAPEASGFEPVSATDMVNLSSGDMAYVLPLLEIDGFPVTLSYHAGIPMDMEASWVGLGWNLNTGAIARGVVANPDDWDNGQRLNLTYLNGHMDTYSVNVGVGIAKSAEVGVGLSWGSNKSLSGSVSASVGPLSASLDTNGNYSIGVGSGAFMKGAFQGIFDKIDTPSKGSSSPFGGSLSISGNVNKGGISANIGVGGSSNGVSASMGVSISGQGIGGSYSVGGNNQKGGSKAGSGGASVSMNSFSAGDYSYNSKGFYIPLQIGVLSFGFGFNRTEITVAKAFKKYGYGVLYHSDNALYDDNNLLGENLPDSGYFTDYKKRNEYGDVYEQVLPQQEEEFIGDYRNQIEKLNFTFAGYDSYDINASGIGGTLRPIIGENTSLMGEGYDGASIRTDRDKTKVFYHYGNSTLKPSKTLQNDALHFVFDGQITEKAVNTEYGLYDKTGTNLNLSQFVIKGTYSITDRPKAGSYVEVFTNSQIDANHELMLTPASLFDNENGSTASRELQGYVPGGIGGYKITTPDGKTYYFAQPVYQYEQIQHNYVNFDGVSGPSKYNSSSKREATPYATHWLLTAITGPDYFDNGNNFPDEGDTGYWVRLDYGQWSNAFAWRSPYDNGDYTFIGTRRHYSTYIDADVEKADPGYFVQGRKDLYYLDKIVSKTQTAYFVKDIRYDGVGTEADYKFDTSEDGNSNYFKDQLTTENPSYTYEDAQYDKEYQLKLDKIVIVNNKGGAQVSNQRFPETLRGISAQTYTTSRYGSGSYFDSQLVQANKVHRLHQSNNILDTEDFQNFDYRKAVKVIKFNHDPNRSEYLLAPKTPSSGWENGQAIYPENPTAGRLTLRSVKTYGKGLFDGATESDLYDYMPAYTFDYYKPQLPHEENHLERILGTSTPPPFSGGEERRLVRANKDNWGFRSAMIDTDNDGVPENSIDAWSLKSITTPQGASIDVEYEEDDFYVEAFGRRYWENSLSFNIVEVLDDYIEIVIKNDKTLNQQYVTNLEDYFSIGDRVFLDLWLHRRWDMGFPLYHDDHVRLNILPSDICTVTNIISGAQDIDDEVIVRVVRRYDDDFIRVVWDYLVDVEFSKTYAQSTINSDWDSHVFEPGPRGFEVGTMGPNEDHWTMTYKLLANKVAPGTNGGGLRVKKIVVDNKEGHKYITSYDYTNPFTEESSGITSFNPVHGEVFVPYQNELPGPGVMYEWVTMTASGIDNNGVEKPLSSIRYHYYTLKPIFDIFNPTIDMKDIDGKSIFKATVLEEPMSLDKLTAKKMNVEKDLTKIGQLISTEEFNSQGQLMNKSKNYYRDRVGELSETFSSMKSVFDFNEDDNGIQSDFSLIQRYLAQSTKSEKVSVVSQIDNFAGGIKTSVKYDNPDEYLGTYRTSIRTMADGTMVKEEKIPAYDKYPAMGSKIVNPSNRNMLTQEAMSITSVANDKNAQGDFVWKTTSANVTTWNDDWSNVHGFVKIGVPLVWRKHQSFVWKDEVDDNGTYGIELTANDFNWGIGDSQTNIQWQKVSEITQYTRWSTPIETMDINGNFASSIMADNKTKTIAGGNAKLSEMRYSGAEYVTDDQNTYDGDVLGASYRSYEKAHTGKYSSKVTSLNDKVFEINGEVGLNRDDLSKDFRPGVYKVSFWANEINGIYDDFLYPGTTLKLNGVTKGFNEKIKAGDWIQYNYYVSLEPGSTINLFVTNTNNTPSYFDDFRMHPVYASMNSYVYDQDTDQLTYILDANNMATRFRYDDAGRLCKTYKEVTDAKEYVGGFKLTNKYKYNYKDVPVTSCQCCEDEVIDYKPMAVDDEIYVATKQGVQIPVTQNDNFGGDGPSSNSIAIITQPVNGYATVNDNGTPTNPQDDYLDYTPPIGFQGMDTISYQICDADGDCSQAVVTITLDTPYYDVYFEISQITDERVEGELHGIPGSVITYYVMRGTTTTDSTADYGVAVAEVDGPPETTVDYGVQSDNKTVTLTSGVVPCWVNVFNTNDPGAYAKIVIVSASEGIISPEKNELTDTNN